MLETITNLSTELTHTQALIQETGNTSPNNPALDIWRAKTMALQNQIDKEREKIAGRDGALAPKVADYERLSLARELAERGLGAATASLEAARQEARRQQIYVEDIVPPNLPDEAGEPRRLQSIARCYRGHAVGRGDLLDPVGGRQGARSLTILMRTMHGSRSSAFRARLQTPNAGHQRLDDPRGDEPFWA